MPNKATQDSLPTRGSVVGLFHNESQAEVATAELREAGFSAVEIGVATAAQDTNAAKQSDDDFWSKVAGLVGKQEHSEGSSDHVEDLLAAFAQHQAQRPLSKGDILVTVRASEEREIIARNILGRAGAEMGGVEASLASGATPGSERIEVPVTREVQVIEPVAAEGRGSGVEIGAREKEMRVPLSEIHVEKKPVVNEEIRVGKCQLQDTKRVPYTARGEELRTEQEGDVKGEEVSGLKDQRRSA